MTKTTLPFALFDAFSDQQFGGSQAGIVLNGHHLNKNQRQQIASELGFPATCFVEDIKNDAVTVRFHSTEREYPMCGHGTICLMTWLFELGKIKPGEKDAFGVELVLPKTTTRVEIKATNKTHPMILLDVAPPTFRNDNLAPQTLAKLFSIAPEDIDLATPVETANGDFSHLVIPLKSLLAIQSIKPDFTAITKFCHENNIETIACFSRQTERTDFDFHIRDFCPAVGVPESAAAGTTNAALACYAHRHGIVSASHKGPIFIKAEQGIELGRPSIINTIIHTSNKQIDRLQVGGVATKVLSGQIELATA